MFHKSVQVFALGLCIWIGSYVAANPLKQDVDLWLSEPSSDLHSSLTCPNGFTLLGDNCYFFEFTKTLSWLSSYVFCDDLNSKLIEHISKDDIERIHKHFMDTNLYEISEEFWILEKSHSNLCPQIRFLDEFQYEFDETLCHFEQSFICKSPATKKRQINWVEDLSASEEQTTEQSTEDSVTFTPDEESDTDAADEFTEESTEEETFTTTTIIPTTTPILAEASCPTDFKKLGNKCYYIEESQKLNWYETDRRCKNMKGKMLTIENANEMRLVEDAIIELGIVRFSRQDWTGFWTAGTDLGSEGSFHWQTTGRQMSYAKWFVGEPNNAGFNEDCVELRYIDRQLFMNDRICMRENYFVCESELQTANVEIVTLPETSSALKSSSCEDLKLLKQNFEAQQLILNMLYGEQQCERNE